MEMMGMRCDRLRITDTTIASINHPNSTKHVPNPHPTDRETRGGEGERGGGNKRGGKHTL